MEEAGRYGLLVIARDEGAGIRPGGALRDEYSGRDGLGLGLQGWRQMDEFEIDSDADTGTTETMKKWRPRDELERRRRERRSRG